MMMGAWQTRQQQVRPPAFRPNNPEPALYIKVKTPKAKPQTAPGAAQATHQTKVEVTPHTVTQKPAGSSSAPIRPVAPVATQTEATTPIVTTRHGFFGGLLHHLGRLTHRIRQAMTPAPRQARIITMDSFSTGLLLTPHRLGTLNRIPDPRTLHSMRQARIISALEYDTFMSLMMPQ